LPAKQVHDELEHARASVAQIIGARPVEITFTAGGSEANNLAIHGVMRAHPDAKVLVSTIEHESVLATVEPYAHELIPVTAQGIVEIEQLKKAIDDQTVLVSIMYANNEIGTVQPVREIAAVIAEIRKYRQKAGNKLPLLFHTDAAQAANYLDIHVARLGVDLMTLNGGKLYGPKQSGALYVRAGVVLQPLIRGGGQEHGLRSGTENVAACVGFATALNEAQTMRRKETARLQKLQKRFIDEIQSKIPTVVLNGSASKRLPNNIHLTFAGADNERLLLQLESEGILAAAGSACSASNDEPSHVLKALGVSEQDAQSSVRFTMGRSTTEAMIDRLVGTLQ
jgi:cysteine desulfurase